MSRDPDAVLKDIKEYPERHRHDFAGLYACCVINDVLHAWLLQAHSQYAPVGITAGIPCDTIKGPCSCGSWH